MQSCECAHWRPVPLLVNGGRCEMGRYGGRVAFAVCAQCPDYDGPARGLGDVIASAAKKVGLKPCGGCQKRRESLNRRFPKA